MARLTIAILLTKSSTLWVVLLLCLLLLSLFAVVVLAVANVKLRRREDRAVADSETKADQILRISHDIRGSLNVIMGFATVLKEQEDLAPQVREDMSKIEDSGRYLENLVNDLGDVTRMGQGRVELELETVNDIKFLEGIASFFGAEARRKDIELVTSFDLSAGQYVVMDSVKCRRIYSNLLSNAIKYSPAGTCIKWVVEERQLSDNRYVMVSTIEDQGCGMSPEFMRKMFDPFEQEMNYQSNESTGTGLGLCIVKSLVDLMGGTITVDSKIGQGTKFTVVMERRQGRAADMPQTQTDTEVEKTNYLEGKRILVCEDRPLNMQIMTMMLERYGMVVTSATNGKQGLERFKASPQDYFSAIIMDNRMPVMDGMQATAEIRSLLRPDAKEIPIVAVTGGIYDETSEEAYRAGVSEHLVKPVSQEQLYSVLSRLVREK